MGARASRLGFLGAPWQLSGDLLCFLGTTFGHSSSLQALSGCLLEPNCAPKALRDHSQNVLWSQNLEISSNCDLNIIMRFPPGSNPSVPSNSPILQASNHPIIQIGTAECAERLNKVAAVQNYMTDLDHRNWVCQPPAGHSDCFLLLAIHIP